MFGFQTKTKELDEVRFVETSSVVDDTDISINVSIGRADVGADEDMFTPDFQMFICS